MDFYSKLDKNSKNLWIESQILIINSKLNDYFYVGDMKVEVTKRTKSRIWFSDSTIITVTKSKFGYLHFTGKNTNNLIRNLEGYLIFRIQST